MPVSKSQTNSKQLSNKKPIIGYVLGGISFIPLIGIPFAIVAIIIGITRKSKGPIILGICGILLTVVLYGSLFYFGFIAKSGPFAELKKPLTMQVLNQTKGQILIYKDKYGRLPSSLSELGPSTQQNPVFTFDGWNHPLMYIPHPDGTFELKSNGPDNISNTSDDVFPSQ